MRAASVQPYSRTCPDPASADTRSARLKKLANVVRAACARCKNRGQRLTSLNSIWQHSSREDSEECSESAPVGTSPHAGLL